MRIICINSFVIPESLLRMTMSTIWLGFMAIIAITAALPVNNLDEETLLQLLSKLDGFGRNSALENILIGVIEELRGVMTTGSDDIPVLDPFYQDRLFMDDSIIPIPGAHIELNDLTVSKLSTFELNTVSISSASILLQRYNVVVDAEVPAIEVDVGKYDLFVNLNGLSLFGAGDAKIIVVKPRIKVTLLVGIRVRLGAIYLTILNTRIDISLADFQPAITGMFHEPAVENFFNLFIRNLVLEIMDAYSGLITDTVSPLVQDLANDFLSDLNLISLLG